MLIILLALLTDGVHYLQLILTGKRFSAPCFDLLWIVILTEEDVTFLIDTLTPLATCNWQLLLATQCLESPLPYIHLACSPPTLHGYNDTRVRRYLHLVLKLIIYGTNGWWCRCCFFVCFVLYLSPASRQRICFIQKTEKMYEPLHSDFKMIPESSTKC